MSLRPAVSNTPKVLEGVLPVPCGVDATLSLALTGKNGNCQGGSGRLCRTKAHCGPELFEQTAGVVPLDVRVGPS